MIRRLAKILLIAFLLLLVVLYALSTNWPEPQRWHSVSLDQEFDRGQLDQVDSFADYLALEERLFQQLQEQIYEQTASGPDHRFERYSQGSAADPSNREPNWNRSFELAVDEPRGGILLLHGMSDSPYSLRSLAATFHAQGYRVLGLRLPGHGTAPSGLLHVSWQDMAAATRLAASHLASEVSNKPLHLVGYSTGAPLALDYALTSQADSTLQVPASLILISPAIGVSPAAVLAQWNRRLSYLPGLGQLAWLDMLPEFDPYKYNSFATNAGEQVHLLTRSVANRIAEAAATGPLKMPPVLVLKSTVDATVSNSAVVDRLLTHLDGETHEFVLFDINRRGANASLLVTDPGPFTNQLLAAPELPFTLTVITNADGSSDAVVARRRVPRSATVDEDVPLGLAWPAATLSLSHIALPFPPDDPLYGRVHPGNDAEIFLGHPGLQGERGLLRFSSDWLVRLRNNPFHSYLEQRVVDWVDANTQ